MTAEEDLFSLAGAREAAADGKLGDWVSDFLSSPGSDNAVLAAAIGFAGATYAGPLHFELARLTPMAGPDDDEVVVPIDEDEWEADVGAMRDSVQHGWEPPPLLISQRDGQFVLEDGNHRYESLRRAGETHAWAIVMFSSTEERERFTANVAADGAPPASPPP